MDTRYEGSFIVFLRVTLWFSLLAVFDATDVYMNCPAEPWVIGNQVTIHCSALKTAYPSQCTSINREVEFRRSPNDASYTARCSLDDVENTCTSSSSDCKCSNSNSTHFNFQYTFSVAADSSGYWECNVPCLNGITPQLTYSSSADCKDRNVTVGPCDGVNCKNCGTCYVDDNNQAKCNCSGTYYKGDFCETNICADKDCHEGTCYVYGETAKCDCTGTSGGDDCSGHITVYFINIGLGCTVVVIFGGNGYLIGIVLYFRWKRKYSSVICVTVCVDNEAKKTALHSVDTKEKLQDFVSEHFALHCCCCCCCSWLTWCCLVGLMVRGTKGDGDAEGGTFARSGGCSMGCVWCSSSVQKVEVDVHDIKDNQVLVLITVENPLSWYSEAGDMPEKVKEYIRRDILMEPGRELCNTSKPSMHLSVGRIAGSPDPRNEPPADYPAGSGR